MVSKQILQYEIVGTQEQESFDAFQYFEKRLSLVLETHLHESPPTHLLSFNEKKMIFALLWYVCSPQRAPENAINDSDLKNIGEMYQQIVHRFRINHEGKKITLLDYNILAAFYHILYHGIKSRKRAGNLKEAFAVPVLEGVSMLKAVPDMYTACFSLLINRLNDVRKHYYSLDMMRSDGKGKLSMTLRPVISLYWARRESMMIYRAFRSVYKLASPHYFSGIKWLKIPKEKLEHHYKGIKTDLKVYIQTHALNRLKERLDVFDQMTLNDILSSNLRNISAFEYYKGNLLLPIQLYQIKVGYLVCDVIDDKLVVRTFRFITHNNTPEGDRLLECYIQSKSNITCCHLDKLSLLFDVEDEVSIKLYNEAGLADLFHLKDHNLNIDAMQEANYEEFLAYIKQGEETEHSVVSLNQNDSALMDYSLGRLLKLLFLNTLGLSAAMFTKTFYSLAHRIKGLGKLNTDLNIREKKLDSTDLSNAKLIMRKEFDLVHSESENYEEQVS